MKLFNGINKIFLKIDKSCETIKFEVLAMILVLIIGSITLFIKPIIGVSNNGDFFRIITENGIHYLDNNPKEQEDMYFKYFQKDYGINKYYNDNAKMIVSTQSLLIKPAVLLDNVITGNDEIFDLRFLAFILLIFQSIASYLIIKVFTSYLRRPLYRLLITLLYIFIFMDVGYIAYFNSFYGEGLNIPFFLLSIGILLYMIRFQKFTVINLLAFLISSFIFFGSKQQLAPTGILLAILMLRIIYYTEKPSVKVVSSVMIIAFVIGAGFFYRSIEGDFDYINRYHSLNRGILLDEGDADNILANMKINNQYSLLENTIYFENIPQINLKDENIIKDYYDHFTISKIVKYYILHPSDMYKMMKIGFLNAYDIRPHTQGNYEKSEGKEPYAKSYFFSSWSTFKEKFLPKTVLASVIYVGVFFYGGVKRYIYGFKNNNKQIMLIEEVFLYIFLVGLVQIATSLVGAGDADLSKHEFMYNMTLDIMFLYFILNILMNKENREV